MQEGVASFADVQEALSFFRRVSCTAPQDAMDYLSVAAKQMFANDKDKGDALMKSALAVVQDMQRETALYCKSPHLGSRPVSWLADQVIELSTDLTWNGILREVQ